MTEVDCNKNVFQKINTKSLDGSKINITIFSRFNVDQLISCTPLTRDKSDMHATSAVFKGMSVVFSRTEIEESLHQYELSFGGGDATKRRRVVVLFERQLGKVDRIKSFKPRIFKGSISEVNGYLWDVHIN